MCELKPEPQEKYFGTLVTGIVSQQLPPDVSLQLLKNLGKFLGNPLQPQAVLDASMEDLCEQGLVKQKAEYLKSFAEAVVAGKVTIENSIVSYRTFAATIPGACFLLPFLRDRVGRTA